MREGFRFDTGPSLLLAKDVYEDTFRALGSDLYDHVQLQRIEPPYRCFLSDNSNVSLSADLHAMQSQLEALEEGSFVVSCPLHRCIVRGGDGLLSPSQPPPLPPPLLCLSFCLSLSRPLCVRM